MITLVQQKASATNNTILKTYIIAMFITDKLIFWCLYISEIFGKYLNHYQMN